MKKNIILLFVVFCLFINNQLHAQWCAVDSGLTKSTVYSLAISSSGYIFAGTTGGGVYLSTNNGTSWTAVDSGLTNPSVYDVNALAVVGTSIFAGTARGVFLSTNIGTSWTEIDSGLTNYRVEDLAISVNGAGDTSLFAAVNSLSIIGGGGISRSTDFGLHWNWSDQGLSFADVYNIFASDTNLFAGTGGGPYRSTDNGKSWTAIDSGLTSPYGLGVNDFIVSNAILFAGSDDCVYRSTDNGTSWTAAGLTGSIVETFAVAGTSIFAGTRGGVFQSINNGTSWSVVNTGLVNTVIHCFAVNDTYLFVGTNAGVWRRPLSEMVTGVGGNQKQTPTHYILEQNYPNPFNPSTTISFSLPSKSFVSIKVFDIIGKEVATILSEEMSAGSYTWQWNAGKMSSGIYFYRLQAGSYSETKKLVLLK